MIHHDEIIETINRNSDMVYRLAFAQMKNEVDADDVYQEVFFRYIRKQPEFECAEHEKAWFIRVTLNCSKTNLKSFWKTKVCELDESFESVNVEKEDLSYALKKLPKKYCTVLYLFYYEDMSIKEIASALNLKEGNVGVLLSRSRLKLKEILEKENYV
uniref:RNA polymerase sigma factor n=1 Tax=Eubacterium sp. TaxID=142586 RepID=UPI004025DDC4